MLNLMLSADSYKYKMWDFYEPGITEMYEYLESRGGVFGDVTFFGAQAFLKKYLLGSVFKPEHYEEAQEFCELHFGRTDVFNRNGWKYIVEDLNGVPPVEIYALPEGVTVPVRTSLLAYKNTDWNCAWIAPFLETFLFKLWAPTTVCTLTQHIKKVLYKAYEETGSLANLPYAFWDFSPRGVSSHESAEFCGAGVLVGFSGSDNVPAIQLVRKYYSKDPKYMPAISVRATEHSIMTHRGRDHEADVVGELLRKCPDGILAMVADSFSLWNFAENIIGKQFKSEVIRRGENGVTVIRPDSGDPIPTMLRLLWILGEQFGYTVNQKGYKVLNHNVRTLQGDGNTYDTIYEMCRALKGAGWSTDNLACWGMGGALCQAPTRDTQKMAIKLSSLTNKYGQWRDVFKDPITDPGKYSKTGRFAVVQETDPNTGKKKIGTKILKQGDPVPVNNLLRPIYRNGELLVDEDFETIRQRADGWTKSDDEQAA